MYKRKLKILLSNSFLLFGARGTGKSSLLKEIIPEKNSLWIDLLLPDQEALYSENPQRLIEQIDALKHLPEWIVIDEVQKVPKLLDIVHSEIEKRKIKFALTGSSARKLKRGGANLLAGRAFVSHLYPFTFTELGKDFNLINALSWGTLPFVVNATSDEMRKAYLQSYVDTYLKEEILQEQIIRKVIPFRKFLLIAAQLNGTMLNYNSIAKDLKTDWATVRSYFEILEDTLLGFNLPAYDKSLRKQQLKSSKFYLFDLGVKRALDRTLSLELSSGQMIGPLFEHFIITEIYRLNEYQKKDFSLSYLATQGGLEVDLIVERPGEKTAFIEIKSSEIIQESHLKHLQALSKDYPDFEFFCFCREKIARKVGLIKILPWDKGIKVLGL